MVSLHLRELSLTSNVHSLLPSPPKIQEVESWLKYWTSTFIIVAYSPHLKFSQTGKERSLVNKNVEKIKIKNISKQETKRIKHFKSSKIHLSPFQIMTTSFRLAKTMYFALHHSTSILWTDSSSIHLSPGTWPRTNHSESKVHDHFNAKSWIIPREYHTEWTQGVDPSRYWKEQEPEQWAGISFTRTATWKKGERIKSKCMHFMYPRVFIKYLWNLPKLKRVNDSLIFLLLFPSNKPQIVMNGSKHIRLS